MPGFVACCGVRVRFIREGDLAVGGSWLCYFRALQIGPVSSVVAVDKSSTVLTMVLAVILLGESLTWFKALSMALIGTGTCLMATAGSASRSSARNSGVAASSISPSYAWLFYAGGAALFASLTAILGKVGIEGVESNLGTAIRTMVVLVVVWLIVLGQRTAPQIRHISGRSWLFLVLSGLATGGSRLLFYRALQEGPASVVVPVDKLSIVVTVAFSAWVLKERVGQKSLLGLLLIVAGTMTLLW